MAIHEKMMGMLNKIRGKIKPTTGGKQTYYGYGKEVIGKEGSVKKRKKKTEEVYKELFPND